MRVSGYSGGGKSMIEAYEVAKSAASFELYGLGLEHKHVPELQKYSRLERRPNLCAVGGQLPAGHAGTIPLHLDSLPGQPNLTDIEETLAKHYNGSQLVSVVRDAAGVFKGRIAAEELNGTDAMQLAVFGNPGHRQAVLVARLDNLGKGAFRRGRAKHPPHAGTKLIVQVRSKWNRSSRCGLL